MHKHRVIEFELSAGRSDEAIVRRLYSVDLPVAFERERAEFFDVMEACSSMLEVSVYDIKVAGSGQTGYSFHNERPFDAGRSDLDIAVINKDLFEKLLRATQKIALPDPDTLERPRRNLFPTFRGENTYSRFVENVAMYGLILPQHLPHSAERETIYRVSRRLSTDHSTMFRNVNLAFYISQYFFERKQRPNLGIYKRARKGQ